MNGETGGRQGGGGAAHREHAKSAGGPEEKTVLSFRPGLVILPCGQAEPAWAGGQEQEANPVEKGHCALRESREPEHWGEHTRAGSPASTEESANSEKPSLFQGLRIV